MTDRKLTPRVGDRVLVIRGFDSRVPFSKGGWVRGFTEFGGPLVDVDGVPERIMVPIPHIEVLDREPVEWPEGWEGDEYGHAYHQPSNCAFSKDGLKLVLATGPDMLARWDELMGGDQ